MKLNLFLTTFLLVFQFSQSFGQDFAPIGAKWYYTEKYFMSGDIGFLTAESVKDTIVKGQECRQIVNDILCGAYESGINYIYQEDSIVYFFNQKTDDFQILYNFKAQKGDSWTTVFFVMEELDTLRATVDTVFTANINGVELVRQRIKYSRPNENPIDTWFYNAEVTERIGDSYFLFNLYSPSVICDGNWSEGLRCYEDTDFGFYSTGIAESCTYTYDWVGVNDNYSDIDIKIYPNPATSWIDVECKTNSKLTISILDLSGKCLKQFEIIGNTRLDMTSIAKGFYILQIKNADKILGSRKIVKN